jgi:hypothetical protein
VRFISQVEVEAKELSDGAKDLWEVDRDWNRTSGADNNGEKGARVRTRLLLSASRCVEQEGERGAAATVSRTRAFRLNTDTLFFNFCKKPRGRL